MAERSSTKPQPGTPLRVGLLFDGSGLGFGVFEVSRTLLRELDRARVTPIGLFLGPGRERDVLRRLCDETRDLKTGNLLPIVPPGCGRYHVPNLIHKATIFAHAVCATATAIRQMRLDVLHVHFFPLHIVAGLACRLAATPCIWHWHGVAEQSGMRRTLVAFAQRTLATDFACISQFVHSSLPPAVRAKSRVIHNGIPVARIREHQRHGALRHMLGLVPDARLVGIFGSFTPYKGHEYFLQAAARVRATRADVHFVIVGDETDVQRRRFRRSATLHQLSRDYDIDACVTFTGYLDDAPLYMGDCDIVCIPTIPDGIRGEGFGLVVVEAMAAGAVPIATRCGAAPELIEDGVDGRLVPPRDSESLATAILELLGDNDHYRTMLQTGARRVAERFDDGIMARRIEQLYSACAGRRARVGSIGRCWPADRCSVREKE